MPLAGAAAALEFGPHLGAHDYPPVVRVGGQHGQVQEIDKGGMRQAPLQLLLAQRRRGLRVAPPGVHGVITSLPNTCRCSSRSSASGARSSGKVWSITASSRPACTMSNSAVMSSRAQPFEPRIFNSKVQM